jgi:sn-2 palmitoyl-lipid 9-desaturase
MTRYLTAAQPGSVYAWNKLSWTNVGFFGIMHGLAVLGFWCFSWQALGVAVFLHWLIGGIGICLTYHRLLTHRSFQVPRWLEYILATIGALAMQGGPIFWVAGHRVHHAYTEDEVRDPYAASRGFWWSHMLWILFPNKQFFDFELYKKSAPDLTRQAYYRWLDKNFLLLQVLLGFVLYALGGWSFVIYGIFVRSVILWHTTWLINSATHWRGYQNFAVEDGSRNLWWAALLTYGEGWHNNHHARPKVAKAGLKWWEVDMTWWAIVGLKRLGLATRIVK